MSRLAVIICIYNTKVDLFARCLQSIFASTVKDLEVIVVDKMVKPFDKVLLDKVADFYGFDNYDYSLYK